MSIPEQTFDALHRNLVEKNVAYSDRDVVLCPICLREISRDYFLASGVEHILPRNILKDDDKGKRRLGSINQRAGITVLCRQERTCVSDGKACVDGCNGLKGRLYDRLYKGLLDDADHADANLMHRHSVAILVMAYLGAFQHFGYDYILRPELDDIRAQFDFPDSRKTNWLDHAKYCTAESKSQIVVTVLGTPFIVGGITTPDAPLHVLFRRFSAYLPRGHWQSKGVDPVPLLRPEVD